MIVVQQIRLCGHVSEVSAVDWDGDGADDHGGLPNDGGYNMGKDSEIGQRATIDRSRIVVQR